MISPLSAKKTPVIALNSVDFPAPLLPTIVANSPCFKVRFRFFNAHFSLTVPGLKVFDIVQSLTNGGPGNATSVFGTLIYSSFSSGSYGRGCAASMILTFFVLLIALPTNRFISRKEVEV